MSQKRICAFVAKLGIVLEVNGATFQWLIFDYAINCRLFLLEEIYSQLNSFSKIPIEHINAPNLASYYYYLLLSADRLSQQPLMVFLTTTYQ